MAGALPWTPEEIARLLELHGEGKTDTQIAEGLGRTMRMTAARRHRMGLKCNFVTTCRPYKKIMPPCFPARALELVVDLAAHYKVGGNVITRWRKEIGVVKRSAPGIRQDRPSRAKSPTPKQSWGYVKPVAPQASDGTIAAAARLHLQRSGFKPVVKIEYTDMAGKAPNGHYVVGGVDAPLSPEALVEFAAARGFRQGASL